MIMKHTIRQVTLLALLTLASTGIAHAQSPPLWGELSPGAYAVGFKSLWQLDYSRRYNTTFDDKTTYATGKAPRPILINVWYPARKAGDLKPMPHRDYLNIQSADPQLAKFATKLAEYEHVIIAKEIMGKAIKELTDQEKASLNKFLDTPTASLRDASPAEGKFPLVIYHAGAGSSFEDNAVLCEFLASHGFVVLGSAFPDQSGQSFNTDNREGSAGDMEFLIAYSRQVPNADWNRIGLVGHSAGAQAALTYRSQPGCAVDAVVSLDTTQDYHGLKNPLWQYTAQVARNGANFNCPLLMVAAPHAFFERADALRHSERYYLTLGGVGHNDYITQGNVKRQLYLHNADLTADARAKENAAREKAQSGY